MTAKSLALGWNDFFVQRKLDGERVLLHWKRAGFQHGVGAAASSSGSGDAPQVRLFSRKLNPQPDREIVMAPWFARALDGLDEAVLDGEMLGWDPGPDADGGAFMNHRFVRAATMAMLKGSGRGYSGGGGGDGAGGGGSDRDDDDGGNDAAAGGKRHGGGGGGGGKRYGRNDKSNGGKPSDYHSFDATSMGGIHLIYNAFDLLWARGRAAERQGVDGDLTSWPLWQRLQMLELLVVQQPRYVEILPSKRMQVARTSDGAGSAERELAAEFEAAIYRCVRRLAGGSGALRHCEPPPAA